jgi:nitrite reductase (NADH) large subunit
VSKERLVVIGNGMAGARTVEEIFERGGGDQYEVTIFGEEPYGNYNRILLSEVLSGAYEPQSIFINSLEWYVDRGIRLHAGLPAERIDLQAQVVDGGSVSEPYDKLILATGSRPLVPRLADLHGHDGAWKRGVFVFRSLDDCDQIAAYAKRCRRAAVIGGGLLGLEAARGLLTHGPEVHVVQREDTVMNLQLDSRAGRMLQSTLKNLGLHVHTGATTTGVLGGHNVTGLAFDNGETLECDMVVLACGITPNVSLARDAGLSVERGIVVDDQMRCVNDPRVFAVGECAQHRGQVYGLVAPLWEQARVLAEHLSDVNPGAAYEGSRLYTRLKVMGVELATMGDKDSDDPADEVILYSEPSRGVYQKLIVRDNQLVGAILLGDTEAASSLVQLFDRQTPLPDRRADLLFPSSGSASLSAEPQALADDTQVCNCNGVSKAAIVASVQAGKRTLGAVCGATRAGTGCGSCKDLVRRITEWACDGQLDEDPTAHYYVPGVPLTKPRLIEAIREHGLKSVSAVFRTLANGIEDAGSKAGLASLLKTIWGAEYEDERDARFINDRVHANVQKDSTFSVVPRIYGGVTSPDELRRIADVAEKYGVRMVKITGGQRIDLLGVAKADLPHVWEELGMPSGHAYTKAFRTCKTCVGTDFCRYGLGDSTALGIAVEKRFQGMESPHKMKLATTGCPRNCAEATTKDLGAVAIGGGRWEVYVGGAAGSTVRKGDVLCTVDSHDDVLRYMGRFMQYYREQAKYLERSYTFVERVGIEHLRQVLVEDSEGICERLDAEIDAAVAAYRDPWHERQNRVHSNQFATVVAVIDQAAAELQMAQPA